MIKILIADDHSVVRAGIRKFLEKEVELQIIGEAESYSEVLNFIREDDPDLIILDINMPGKNGLETLKEIRKIKPELRSLILSIYPEDSFAKKAFEAGAWGYLTKESKPDELLRAVKIITAGGKYVSESMIDILTSNAEKKENKPLHEKLTEREMEILLLIGEGKTISEIAEIKSISINTVSTHRAHILEKMKMQTNAKLIHYVVKNNLLE